MASSKHRKKNSHHAGQIKDPAWSKGKKIFMGIITVVLGIFCLLVIMGALLTYYRLTSK